MEYLLDTNIVSGLIKGNQAIIDKVVAAKISSLYVSSITVYELRYGAARRGNPKRLTRLIDAALARLEILSWTVDVATTCGHLRAKIAKRGLALGSVDMMIAAHAYHHQMSIVSNDAAFARVKELKVCDWSASD